MKYNTIKFNDIANGPGIALSFFTQGCPHHCPNCFNPETWDFDRGQEFTDNALNSIIKGLNINGVQRHLAILGGEPLALQNLRVTTIVIETVKRESPQTKIYLWTGYKYEDLKPEIKKYLRERVDYLIDGRYIESERDITLKMRGSRNQRIWDLKANKDVTNEFDK